jgi:osmoprotectant transport system ATP-binding protein
MLAFSCVTKRFSGHTALEDVSLVCPEGQTTVLIGPSGSGKSTLLRLAMGLVRPDSGEVTLDEQDLATADLSTIRHGVGYVTQDGGLFPHLSAYDNATLVAMDLGRDRSSVDHRFQELIEMVKLPGRVALRRPGELSGGERQRVSLIRALMLDPSIVLLDEALSALDPIVRRDLQLELRELFGRLNKSVVWVTHDLSEAVRLGQRIVLLDQGRIVQNGAPAELLDRPVNEFANTFVAAQRGPREALMELAS